MNEYKITYTGESEGYQLVTERTEAAAKKFFLSTRKGIKLDITSIELYRENAIATKQQEWDALAAIQKMVEELGPQSYLATAFEGCFEVAAQNIENDFGDSMKGRAECAEKRLDEAMETIRQLKSDIKLLESSLENERALTKNLEQRLEQETVSATDLAHLTKLAEKDLAEAEQRRDEAAQKIVAYADNPASEEFQQAVHDHRNAQASVEAKKERLARLNTIKNAA